MMSYEERMKRAEEVYQRRKNGGHVSPDTTLQVTERKQIGLFKKLIIQVLICACLYLVFFSIQNSSYLFSEAVVGQVKEVLSYDINMHQATEKVVEYINQVRNIQSLIPEAYQEKQPMQVDTTLGNQAQSLLQQLGEADQASSISQMEEDVHYIQKTTSLIKPVDGTITSSFGSRNPTTPSVPKYHTGIDIANRMGTKIVAAMEGKVTQVSSNGDYGNHLRIQKDDIITLYAHCSKIYVKEGDEIKQGQEIAEIGNTGNVTGPHLHFEIRRNQELVNPEYLIQF